MYPSLLLNVFLKLILQPFRTIQLAQFRNIHASLLVLTSIQFQVQFNIAFTLSETKRLWI